MNLPNTNFYRSYPVADSFHTGNSVGIIRYVDARDSLTLSPFQRLQGDLMHRFILIENAHNALIDFINANPFITGLDEAPYVRMDGTKNFTHPQRGVDGPTDECLTTKAYVDQVGATSANAAGAVGVALTAFKNITPHTFQSGWVSYTWAAGQKVVVDLTVNPTSGLSPNYDTISAVRIIEKLDIAQPTLSNPNPPAEYVYRELTATNKAFALDDFWLIAASNKVRVLIPNLLNFASGYTGSAYEKLQNPRYRWIKGVITALAI